MIIKKNSFEYAIFKSKIPVAVVFVMHVQGLSIARCLSREGVPILAIDSNENNCGLYSKYVTGIISPDAARDESSFIDFLKNIGKNLRSKGILFPTHDVELIALSKHREVLKEYFLYPMSEYEIIDKCIDKFKLYPIAKELGIPIPKTYFPKSTEEVEEISNKIEYPYILKPSRHERFVEIFKKTALRINDRKELLKKYKQVSNKGLDVMIQEEILGRADRLYTLGSYADKKSNLKGIFVGRKIRQFPSDFGTCRFAEPIYEPEVLKLGQCLIKGLNYHGISQVEFKKDPKDNKFKLMELNARSWLWISLSTACDVNLPFIAYKDTIGEKINNQIYNNHLSTKWIFLIPDLINCCGGIYKKKGYPQESLNLLQWLYFIRGKKIEAIFSWKDLKPFIKFLLNNMRKFIKRIFKVQQRKSNKKF